VRKAGKKLHEGAVGKESRNIGGGSSPQKGCLGTLHTRENTFDQGGVGDKEATERFGEGYGMGSRGGTHS